MIVTLCGFFLDGGQKIDENCSVRFSKSGRESASGCRDQGRDRSPLSRSKLSRRENKNEGESESESESESASASSEARVFADVQLPAGNCNYRQTGSIRRGRAGEVEGWSGRENVRAGERVRESESRPVAGRRERE